MLHAVTFKWRQPGYRHEFKAEYVNVLERAVRRNYDGDPRFVCVTDDPDGIDGETFPLWTDFEGVHNNSGADLPSCYRRLKLFDPATQEEMGIEPGDRIVQIDLDTVIVGDLNPLWDRYEAFVGWAVKNRFHDRVFNGSMWMFQAREFSHVWRTFDPVKSPKQAKEAGFLGSDQAVMTMMVGTEQAGWDRSDGIYTRMETMQPGKGLPADASVVMFHGNVKPWDVGAPGWIQRYWK